MNNGKKTNGYKSIKKKKTSNEKKLLTTNERLGRILIAFFFILMLLVIRIGWIQIIQGAELEERMYRRTTYSK